MRIVRRMKATKRALNLNLPTVLVEVAEAYAGANGRSMSDFVAQLLRDHLASRSIPYEADLEGVILRLIAKSSGATEEATEKLLEKLANSAEQLNKVRRKPKREKAA